MALNAHFIGSPRQFNECPLSGALRIREMAGSYTKIEFSVTDSVGGGSIGDVDWISKRVFQVSKFGLFGVYQSHLF